MLAQQASDYDIGGRNFHVQEQPMHENFDLSRVGADQSARSTDLVGLADSLSAEAKLAQPTTLLGSADSPVTSSVNLPEKLLNRPNVTCSDVGADFYDWRTPLLTYLCDPSAKIDKNVQRSAFKYVLHNDELYRRTAEYLLLKCLGSDQARVAIGEVHEDICGTHQSAPKTKWLLCIADFYWPTIMADCFRFYKGCKECQRFRMFS
jgi:hypothetical protein